MRDIGFCELLRRGEITRLPRLFAVQPENCAPLHPTFLTRGDELVVVESNPHRGRRLNREAGAHARGTRGSAPVGRENSGRVGNEIDAAHGELARRASR